MSFLPFLALFTDKIPRAPWLHPPGHFADNLSLLIYHLFLFATLGAWLWFLINRVNPLGIIRSWWKVHQPFNWLWFLISLAIYSTHNLLVLTNLSLSPGEFISAAVGRILTVTIILAAIWIAARIASQAAPTKLRLLPWSLPALLPGFLGADATAIIFWKNSLRYVINQSDEDGPVNPARQLAAAGLETSPFVIILALLAFSFVLFGLCYLSFRFSRKTYPRLALKPTFIFVTLTLTWVGISAEKATSFAWKSRSTVRSVYNSYEVHLSPIKPSPGVVSYQTTWHSAHPPKLDSLPKHSTRPDIFLFLIESVRADAIAAPHAPFLTHFRDHECQPLGQTWSASNGTHHSWFSIFNGQLPSHWGTAMKTIRDGQALPPSPLIQSLKNLEYQIQIRTVCDLSYLGMGSTNFGSPYQVDFLKEAALHSEFAKLTIPEREVENLNEVKNHLLTSPSSGNFHLIAYDSSHFDYTWHPSFSPPYRDYEPNGGFHAFPSPNDVERVRRRYLNSISWIDHEIARFVDFLEDQNRYDNSIIIITGDHGEEFQENGSWFHCSALNVEQTAVPLMIKWPQGTQAPAQKSASHLDLLPSLLDHLGSPTDSFSHLPGRSVLRESETESTQISLTSNCGLTGISMTWRRHGYLATFRWDQSSSNTFPSEIWLDDLIGPEGTLNLTTAEQWDAALRAHFPDAPDRLFSSFETPLPKSQARR